MPCLPCKWAARAVARGWKSAGEPRKTARGKSWAVDLDGRVAGGFSPVEVVGRSATLNGQTDARPRRPSRYGRVQVSAGLIWR